MSELPPLSDRERQEMVQQLSEFFPKVDRDFLDSLLSAADFDLSSAANYLISYFGELKLGTDNAAVGDRSNVDGAAAKLENAPRSAAGRPLEREKQPRMLSASGDAAMSKHHKGPQEENGRETDERFVPEIFVKSGTTANDAEEYDAEYRNTYRHDHFSTSPSDSSQEGECDNEKFVLPKAKLPSSRRAVGQGNGRSGSAKIPVKATGLSKKTSVPTQFPRNAPLQSSRQPVGERTARNLREAPKLDVSRPPTRGNQRNEAQNGAAPQFASRDGIRGHLLASQKVNVRVGPRTNTNVASPTASSSSPVLPKFAGNTQPASSRAPAGKLHHVDVNFQSRNNRDPKVLGVAARNTSQSTAPKAAAAKAGAQTQRPAAGLNGVPVERDFLDVAPAKSPGTPTPRFIKPSAARTNVKAEPRSREERDVAKVIDDYERAERQRAQAPEGAATSAKPPGRARGSENEPNGAQPAGNYNLADLVRMAVQGSDPVDNNPQPAPDTGTRTVARSNSNEQNLELQGTDSPIKYKRGRLLGKGAYGSVYLAFTDKGLLIAVKIISIDEALTGRNDDLDRERRPDDDRETEVERTVRNAQQRFERQFNSVLRETEILSNIHHVNVVKFLGVFHSYDVQACERLSCKIYLFTEYISGDTIANLLKQFGPFSEAITRHYVAQILSGLTFLHGNSIIHRDIKGQNIMVDKHGCVKLIDFGCAKTLVAGSDLDESKRGSRLSSVMSEHWHARQNGQVAAEAEAAKLETLIGTPYWMAPEVIRQEGHSIKSDCWSLGCTVIEMACGTPPWFEQPPWAAMFHIATDDDTPRLRDYAPLYSEEADDFVSHCLERNVRVRYSAHELLDSAFVSESTA